MEARVTTFVAHCTLREFYKVYKSYRLFVFSNRIHLYGAVILCFGMREQNFDFSVKLTHDGNKLDIRAFRVVYFESMRNFFIFNNFCQLNQNCLFGELFR